MKLEKESGVFNDRNSFIGEGGFGIWDLFEEILRWYGFWIYW